MSVLANSVQCLLHLFKCCNQLRNVERVSLAVAYTRTHIACFNINHKITLFLLTFAMQFATANSPAPKANDIGIM